MTKIILTIGGSDPFSGGGIQTDLKTFENHQVFGLSTLTCLATAPKNHFQIHDLETSLVKEQLASIPAGSLDGIKIGLIHSEESILQIATFLKKHAGLPVVLDPVLAFKETTLVKGYPLIEAVDLAKTYVHEAIVSGVQLNAAFGSVWHEGLLAGGVADNDKKN